MDLYLPFNSIDHDRVHNAEDIADMFAFVMTTGVHPSPGDCLHVSAAGGWNLSMAAGRCVIQGRIGVNRTAKTFTLDAPDGVLHRIDSVVLRCDYSQRMITEIIKKGTPASNPVAASLQRDADAWELAVAQVHVAAAATEITQAHIVDTRQNSELCGVASSLIEADPDTLFAQYEAIWAGWFGDQRDDMNQWRQEQEQAFMAWYEGLQAMLEGDIAIELAMRIATLEQKIPATVYEVGRYTFSLLPSAWEAVAVAGQDKQWSATISNSSITSNTDVSVYLDLASMGAPLYDLVTVAAGQVTLYAGKEPENTIAGTMIIQGRRS